jgi:hypothetical protein
VGVTVGVPVWVAVGGTNSVAVAVALGVVVGRGGPRGSATIRGRNSVAAKVSASTERIQPRRPNQPNRVTIASPIHARFDMMNSIPRLVGQTAACSLSGEGKRVILEFIVKLNGIIITYRFGRIGPVADHRTGPGDDVRQVRSFRCYLIVLSLDNWRISGWLSVPERRARITW